jgi:hypothetical protein
LLCKEIAEITQRNTQNELVAAQEKSDFSFNFNCFSQWKAGKVYIFISWSISKKSSLKLSSQMNQNLVEAPMEGSVLGFLKAESKVSDTGSAH